MKGSRAFEGVFSSLSGQAQPAPRCSGGWRNAGWLLRYGLGSDQHLGSGPIGPSAHGLGVVHQQVLYFRQILGGAAMGPLEVTTGVLQQPLGHAIK